MTQQIPILYGTETGNAEYCADLLADRCATKDSQRSRRTWRISTRRTSETSRWSS